MLKNIKFNFVKGDLRKKEERRLDLVNEAGESMKEGRTKVGLG